MASREVSATVEKPPARLRVLKWISPFELGGDGDGVPGFGTDDDLTVTHRNSPQVDSGTVWYKIIVINNGGQTATGLDVDDSNGSLPTNAACPAVPSTLAAGNSWECRYSEDFDDGSPATTTNTASATATNVVPDSNDEATATLRVEACSGSGNRTVPDLIGLDKGEAQAAWTAAGFTGTLNVWTGQPNAEVRTQNRPAYECVAATSTMTVTRTTTP